jgi:hypothetical protein
MDRREAIRKATMLMGGVISAPAIMGVLNGCAAKPTIDWKPSFLTEDQGILITQVSDIIIPKTETPGAKDVGVPGFIDIMVKDVYTNEDQDRFIDGLKAFNEGAEKKYGDPFIELAPEKQLEYTKEVHSAALAEKSAERPFILMAKELTLLGFFTSEPGATQVLQYDPVPGAYHGCVPLEEVGKTWAT